MSEAGAGQYWFSECAKCFAQFRDGPEQAGVCTRCGHENHYTEKDL